MFPTVRADRVDDGLDPLTFFLTCILFWIIILPMTNTNTAAADINLFDILDAAGPVETVEVETIRTVETVTFAGETFTAGEFDALVAAGMVARADGVRRVTTYTTREAAVVLPSIAAA